MRIIMSKQKFVVPAETDIVNQANDLSRASYSMPVIQRRLIYLAMAQVRDGDSTKEFVMPVSAVLKALGMSDDRYRDIEAEADKLFYKHNAVKVKSNNKKGFRIFTWLTDFEYLVPADDDDIAQHTIRIELNRNVLPYAKTLQRNFHQFQIIQMAKLQGRHSLRIFELISSNMGLAGKGGNPPGTWFFQATIPEFREYLAIQEGEYKETALLRQRVIDAPIQEINRANLGLRVVVEYGRRGKFLVSIKFICTLENKGDPKLVNPKPATKTEADDENLIQKNQAVFNEHLELATKQTRIPGDAHPNFFDEALRALKQDPRLVKPGKDPAKGPARKVQKKAASEPDLFSAAGSV
jgi:plasmid replication initiation protein